MTTLKQLLGDAGAGLDESIYGADRLYNVLKAMVQSQSETLKAYQDTIATATLASMIADFETKLTSFRIAAATCGTANTTTVQIQVNGVSKGELSIAHDEDDATKKSLELAVDIAAGDLIEIVVTAAPTAGAGLTASARLQPITIE